MGSFCEGRGSLPKGVFHPPGNVPVDIAVGGDAVDFHGVVVVVGSVVGPNR